MLKEPVERWRNVNGHNLLQLMYEVQKQLICRVLYLFSYFLEHIKFEGTGNF